MKVSYLFILCYEGLGTVRAHTGSPKANWAHQVGQLCHMFNKDVDILQIFSLKKYAMAYWKKCMKRERHFHFEHTFVSEILN